MAKFYLSPAKVVSLCKNKCVLLLCHNNADLDSFCSASIMQQFLKKNKINSTIGVPSHINESAQHFAFAEKVSFQVNPQLSDFDIVLLFDFNSFEQLGKLKESFRALLESKCFDVLAFDHHVPLKESIVKGSNAIANPTCASTTQVLFNFLDTHFTKRMHFFNCIGLVEDTGKFLVGNANSFSSFATSLARSGKTYADVLSFTKQKLPIDERMAFIKAAQRAQIEKLGNVIVLASELSFYQSEAATKLLEFGAQIVLVAGKEKNELSVLSARAETEFKEKYKFNLVNDLLLPLKEKLGGEVGGHSGAAQWKGSAEPEEVLQAALSLLKERLL